MKINICEDEINMFLGKNQVSFWEDFTIANDDDFQLLKRYLRQFFCHGIKEIVYKSGDVHYIDADTGETIFARKKFFSFLWGKRIKERIEYKPWIEE